MALALKQAKIALKSKIDVPVGSVIADSAGNIISSAYNLVHKFNNPLLHAEIIALFRATKFLRSKYLTECSIYITLEPCLMCLDAIVKHRIKKIYYAASDEAKGVLSRNLLLGQKIFNYIPEIYCDIMREESELILEEFFRFIR
ncbi:MAG: nucleoside deaminase [Rickettsia sp.]|nr:nucleoside deaminase [Rickettsia sp.]